MKKILFTFTVFSIAAAALLFTAGCNTVPASLPPVELLPGSQMQILLSDRNNKELAASAALLQHRLAEFPGIKSFIVTEQELKTPVFRTIFLGPVKELDAVGIDTAAAGEKTYGMIAVCGGDIFISGFSGKEKRFSAAGTEAAAKKFAAKFLTRPRQQPAADKKPGSDFTATHPVLPENTVFHLTPEPGKKPAAAARKAA